MSSRDHILSKFALFSGNTGGIDSWLGQNTPDNVIERLARLDEMPLSRPQLDQLLILSHEAGMSEGFFNYYWLTAPQKLGEHPYDVRKLPEFQHSWVEANDIQSLDHLRWGFYRLYVDALLFFGNVREAYRELRAKSYEQLRAYFKSACFDTENLSARGPILPLNVIPKDDRYLVSEMACKSYAPSTEDTQDLLDLLIAAYKEAKGKGITRVKIGELLGGEYMKQHEERQYELTFSADEILEETVESIKELEKKCGTIINKFKEARSAATENTKLYLSMISELDVYVATSMRNRQDFRNMTNACEEIFKDERLSDLNLRYFDPTLSAAEGHEDKGLIECLMVKCAKVLVYMAGEKESFGKDAEAAMALSLGKPVIFHCDAERSLRLFRDVHPLSRLINFETGVAVGVIVTSNTSDVATILYRIFNNDMEYELVQAKPRHLQLKDRLTGSVVRLQTGDDLLRETFWNYYDRIRSGRGDRDRGAIRQ